MIRGTFFEIEVGCSAVKLNEIDQLLTNWTNENLCFDYAIFRDIHSFERYGEHALLIRIWDLNKCVTRFDLVKNLKSEDGYIVIREHKIDRLVSIYNSFNAKW